MLIGEAERIIAESEHRELLRGDYYNLFSVLGLRKKEIMHSRFIADLLNPKGHHKQGALFLERFISRVDAEFNPLYNEESRLERSNFLSENLDYWMTADLDDTWVETEYYLGNVNNQDYEGGFVDIVLVHRGKYLIIENKIDAGDQKGQLKRYNKIAKAQNHISFYLSKTGKGPSEASVVDLKEGRDYVVISYADHILPWLEDCQKEVALIPLLRENLRQYILTIKKLTRKLQPEIQKEMDALLLRNAQTVKIICNSYEGARNRFKLEAMKDFDRLLRNGPVAERRVLAVHDVNGADKKLLAEDTIIVKYPNWQLIEAVGVPFVKWHIKGLLYGNGIITLECVDRTGKHLKLQDRENFKILAKEKQDLNESVKGNSVEALLDRTNREPYLLAAVNALLSFITKIEKLEGLIIVGRFNAFLSI